MRPLRMTIPRVLLFFLRSSFLHPYIYLLLRMLGTGGSSEHGLECIREYPRYKARRAHRERTPQAQIASFNGVLRQDTGAWQGPADRNRAYAARKAREKLAMLEKGYKSPTNISRGSWCSGFSAVSMIECGYCIKQLRSLGWSRTWYDLPSSEVDELHLLRRL